MLGWFEISGVEGWILGFRLWKARQGLPDTGVSGFLKSLSSLRTDSSISHMVVNQGAVVSSVDSKCPVDGVHKRGYPYVGVPSGLCSSGLRF